MAENSKIQWTTHTFNPWRGCTKVSQGCALCYAEAMSRRNQKTLGEWGPSGTRVVAAESMWRQPLKWDRAARDAGERHRVFCASLSDVFEGRETMPEASWKAVEAARVRLFHLISETPNLDWLLLTKRPENVRRLCGGDGVPRSWSESMPPNVWLGTSVENQAAADERIPHLIQTPAAVRFLSVEPLLGPVDLALHQTRQRLPCPDDLPGCEVLHLGPQLLHWVIVGGESGHHARPFDIKWAKSIRDQCRAAGVAFFLKQLGANVEACDIIDAADYFPGDVRLAHGTPGSSNARVYLNDKKGGNPDEWPADLRVREFPEVTR